MKKNPAASTRGLGLDIAAIAAKYLFKTDDLHYGFWTPDLCPEMHNLKAAQENYAQFLMEHIPAGVHRILDVGAGTGAFAKRLVAAGYSVDCVSPAPYLTQRIRANLGPNATVFECTYEELQTENRYDLILFSESFQYVHMQTALDLVCLQMCPHGFLLISDFFRNDTPDAGPMGGGHPLKDFRTLSAACPLHLLSDEDITAQTAPNLDLTNDFVNQVIAPAKAQIFATFSARNPRIFRFLQWCFRRELARADAKYFSNTRTGKTFAHYKSYRVMVFQKT